MADYNYAHKGGENSAKAVGIELPISAKAAIEVCNFIRGRKVQAAKQLLADVATQKQAIPFRRFTDSVGHRKGKGMGSGRFPSDLRVIVVHHASARD